MNHITKSALLSILIVAQAYATVITVGTGGDYPGTAVGLQNAINASVDGDTITILAGTTITVNPTTITVNKQITIQGENPSTCIITTSTITTVMTITASNVTLNNLTISNTKNGSSEVVIACTTLNATGLVFSNLLIQCTEFGITFNANTFTINGCAFQYVGNDATDRFRFIFANGSIGDCIVSNNSFSGILPNVRTRCLELTEQPNLLTGSFTITNNVVSNGGLDVFILQDSFTAGSLALTVSDNRVINVTGERQGSLIAFYAGQDKPLDIYSAITLTGNTYTSTKGIALMGLEGIGGPYDPATDLSSKLFICDNTVTYKTMATSDVNINVDATNGEALVSYESLIYDPFTVALAPCDLGVTQVAQVFATQEILVNMLTWTNPMPALTYYIYKQNNNGTSSLLTKTSNTQVRQFNVPCNEPYTYLIYSENAAQVKSKQLTITSARPPWCKKCCVKKFC